MHRYHFRTKLARKENCVKKAGKENCKKKQEKKTSN
jgi:hypothetical protein